MSLNTLPCCDVRRACHLISDEFERRQTTPSPRDILYFARSQSEAEAFSTALADKMFRALTAADFARSIAAAPGIPNGVRNQIRMAEVRLGIRKPEDFCRGTNA